MLVFVLLTMFMGGLIMLSASLFCLNEMSHRPSLNSAKQGYADRLIYDDTELPAFSQDEEWGDNSENVRHSKLLQFTKTSHQSAKQIPLLGLPDKAFYRIH